MVTSQVQYRGQDRLKHLVFLLHCMLIFVEMKRQSLARLIYLHDNILSPALTLSVCADDEQKI